MAISSEGGLDSPSLLDLPGSTLAGINSYSGGVGNNSYSGEMGSSLVKESKGTQEAMMMMAFAAETEAKECERSTSELTEAELRVRELQAELQRSELQVNSPGKEKI